jgi:uncharacterized membrane protein HdeD (DUF308 family)
MFSKFFSQDNATAKLASFLIVAASILTLATKYFHVSPQVYGWATLVSGVLAVAGQFLQRNKVVSRSGWILFGYSVLTYLSGQIGTVYPEGTQIVGFLGAVAGLLFGPFTTQTPQDPTPPKTL